MFRHQCALLGLSFAALLLIGCGASGKPDASDSAGANTLVQITPTANACPAFVQSLVIPQTIKPGAVADVIVIASDPDGPQSGVAFDWSASSGTFSSSDRPVTRYRCLATGSQQLHVGATDELGCRAELTLPVICLGE